MREANSLVTGISAIVVVGLHASRVSFLSQLLMYVYISSNSSYVELNLSTECMS